MFDPEFFPTPPEVITRILNRVSKNARYFLDPSAGKGDLAEAIQRLGRYSGSSKHVDCLERNPDLAAILREKDFPVVGADWLTYDGVSYYDALVLNPPFSNGDAHLLKAWDFLYNGEIVCLLNSETLRNPYTERRQRLARLIADHGDVEELGACFAHAERPTDVEVSLVYLKKEADDDRVELWTSDTPERPVEGEIGADPQWLAIVDTLGNMQHYYDQANVHMFQAFQHLHKAALYLEANGIYTGHYDKLVLTALDNVGSARAEFARLHRKDAWRAAFAKMDFHKWLDKQQTEQFIRDIEREGVVPFTKENIKGTLHNIYSSRRKLFEMSVANVFDELTRYHKANHVHSEGWKSNDSYKVNKKLVFPWGCEFDDKYCKDFKLRWSGSTMDIYNDLDRVLCVLDGKDFTQCYTIETALRDAFHTLGSYVTSPFDNTAISQYFHIRFFKKGTVHLVWRDEHLWQEFNVTAAAGKRWLGMQTQEEAAAAPRWSPAPVPVEDPPTLAVETEPLSEQTSQLRLY